MNGHRLATTAALCLGLSAIGAPAAAAVVIYDSPGPIQPDENVLMVKGQTGTTVTGNTNKTGTEVTFRSLNSERLTTPSNGQAKVKAVDGSLDALAFYLSDPALGFREVEFNLFKALTGTSTVSITFTSGASGVFNIAQGQNFFSAQATDGDFITRVAFDTNGSGIKELKQVRLGGIGAIAAVPEPGTWAMMLVGFGLVGGVARTRRRGLGLTRAVA